jgi:hypothetical protein
MNMTENRLCEISEEVGISYSSCEAILTENMGMRLVSANFSPRLLTQEQKDNWVCGF